ncbi:PP2C family protein-serine/threonine phosphatase [Occallatibacter savannae]|uniref:PP2C family protein-serine/threonine phosphatase n=1 Tax=Occallatibacter savannae TaxID=1002691 RepID=UPI000D68AF78|nr:SpoIIE family protein phosphatase [Occallatibacter savannae]
MTKWLPIVIACLSPWCEVAAISARAQTFDVDASRLPITEVDAAWRFHLGDDPAWSGPAFDDSGWPSIRPTTSWTSQDIAQSARFVWFRWHLRVPTNTPSLVLELPTIHKSYQLFADGKLIGQVGTLPPGPAHNVISADRVFTVPVGAHAAPKDVTLALRTWQDPSLAGSRNSRVNGGVFVGESDQVMQHFAASKAMALLSDGALYSVNLVSLLVGVSAVILFWLTRERFYLWFALSLACEALFQPVDYAAQHQAWDFYFYTYFEIFLDVLSAAAYILFVVDAVFPGRWKLTLLPLILKLVAELGILLVLWHVVPLVFGDVAYCVAEASTRLVFVWYLIRGWRAGNTYARLLFIPIGLQTLGSVSNNLGLMLSDFKVSWGLEIVPYRVTVVRAPFNVALNQAIDVVVLFAFLVVLVYRFARTSRENQRLASAMQAARDIQQRLVPADLPSAGGLRTQIAYRAAEEVGGDFCQILPRADGSTFIAIGDVSGKGLQAAMLGAVAVGALRSLAEELVPPARVLERMNQTLLQQEHSGFVTCLCIVLSSNGDMEVANAGHLPPYLDGRELPLESGLPLGIVSGSTYEQASFTLPPSARIMLLSDGVVEARSRTGELFGFDRTSRISHLGATEIAAQAHQFGQQDDITVITLDWQSMESLAEPA